MAEETVNNQNQNPGIFSTVMSYIPGIPTWQSSGANTEDHKKTSEHSEEEHHTQNTSGGNAAGENFNTGSNVNTGTGAGSVGNASTGTGTGTGSTGFTSDFGSQTHQPQDNTMGTGNNFGNMGGNASNNTSGTHNAGQYGGDASNNTSGTHNAGQYGGNATSERPNIEYEEDASANQYGSTPQVGSSDGSLGQQSTGTHHSGYNPQTASSDGSTGQQQSGQTDNGVHGAPIEGDGVKGYAIGAPVGSGDTERPNAPGDPSGQVSGAHVEYNPETTDTRDNRGRGTVGTSHGTGDSSFANVKQDDGQGNSSHVMSRSSESHMTHTSVTQM